VDVTPPSIPAAVWIWAAFDPVLIGLALWLGWRADQAGKIVIAALAALGVSLIAAWIITALGLPWIAPLSRSGPMLLPVRTVAALVWSSVGYAARHVSRR